MVGGSHIRAAAARRLPDGLALHTTFTRTFRSAQRFYFFSGPTLRGSMMTHILLTSSARQGPREVIFTVVVLYGDSLPSDRDFQKSTSAQNSFGIPPLRCVRCPTQKSPPKADNRDFPRHPHFAADGVNGRLRVQGCPCFNLSPACGDGVGQGIGTISIRPKLLSLPSHVIRDTTAST